LPTFTGTATDTIHSTPQKLFSTATSLSLLDRWATSINNVRLVTSESDIGVGSQLLADEALAEKDWERDCPYEVTAFEPGRRFAFRSLGETQFSADLNLIGVPAGVQATWTFTAGPNLLIDKIASLVMRSSVRRRTNQQAHRELARLKVLVEK
jgi:hypothetical protein